MKPVFALAVAALATFAVGGALAHTTVPLSTAQGQSDLYVPVPFVNHGDNDDLTVWQESNGHAGLQEDATYDDQGNFLYGPDSQLI